MTRITSILLITLCFSFSGPALALQDQGLKSIISIIDKAIDEYQGKLDDTEAEPAQKETAVKAASSTIVNLSRTLGKLSYSRLQCGQADVLAEFTQRVQQLPEDIRDPMRDAFQQGFDQSRDETPLLSEDECDRLTQSRNLSDEETEAEGKDDEEEKAAEEKAVQKAPKPPEDPSLKHLRIAELSGQLAYKRKFCGDNQVITRDFNEVIAKMPETYQEQARQAYWKGYKHGKRMNKNLSQDNCF